MEGIGERLIIHYVPFTDLSISGGLNILTVLNTLFVMALLLAFLWWAVRRFAEVPGRAQSLVELYLGAFDSLVSSTLELETQEKNRHYLPLIATLFLFICLSNAIVLLPVPHIEEPTADLNVTLGLGCISVGYSLYCAVKARGPLGYLEELCGPLWHDFKLSALFFMPLKVIEEAARLVSISFRLFGNIVGASTIIVVASTLTYYVGVPLVLYAFLLVFEAVVQAFVFSILTLMYINSAIKH
ncbi:MAG TPA: FoF1 ATP synthase subunit a [Candidatus Hydrogenedentes bacterium]|nr:FoF1 ATP synthase subunit a [Candidatus Hydrogenedentota bacterium]HOS02430.1 FoF1 ATP synthase subunit a [Candidatus Hydrogenedentota bacterium]